MWWKSSSVFFDVTRRAVLVFAAILLGAIATAGGGRAAPADAAPAPKLYAIDADGDNVLLNKPGYVTVVLGTNESSQDGARAAGRAMYPFQGLTDFQLIVVADLRDSIAGWVPSIVISRMKTSLDREAIELKPFYLKNGNTNNPRQYSHCIPDFKGTICPQLGWAESTESLRAIIFGPDGHEIRRWDKLENMGRLANDVRSALQAHADAEKKADALKAKAAAAGLAPAPVKH
jgi:hypothetical protein